MSREIKFRAWDKERQEMRQIQLLDWSAWWVSTGSTWERGNSLEYGERNSFNNEETDRHILMQYTGLKDKNGIEIYEGDIVKGKDDYDDRIIGEVQYRVTRFSVNGVKQYTFNQCSLNRQFEIIGNRYENPELLKGEDKNETNS